MTTKIEQMGLDLYNALRGPLSRMETTEEMDNFKINEMISGINTNIIAECMKCAETNIESGKSMMRAGVKMDWDKIDHYNNLIIEACKNTTKKEEEDKMAKANKGGKVEIIEIVVDGIRYTQTRPGYYFKRTEEGQRRIPKSEWEQAFEKYTAEQEQWEAEMEEKKAEEEKKDRETEDSFNGKKAEKKASKPRRSKDIAYDGEGITLTAKQVDFIRHLPDTNFWEHGLDSMPWCDVLADEIGGQFAGKPMTVGAMISTLREKHLLNVGMERVNGKKAKYLVLTELGKKVAKDLGLE